MVGSGRTLPAEGRLHTTAAREVVGATTGGGAHAEAPHRIDDHFFIRIPFARFVNPITKKDWEGTGVEPDVKVSAADALPVAEKLATAEMSRNRHP
jgi:C-terminal processing protease CtpA/Prc